MHEPISQDVAKKLCDTFDVQPYPFSVCETLRAFFGQDPVKKAEFVAAANQAGATPPPSLI
jgi:hypothetical protein